MGADNVICGDTHISTRPDRFVVCSKEAGHDGTHWSAPFGGVVVEWTTGNSSTVEVARHIESAAQPEFVDEVTYSDLRRGDWIVIDGRIEQLVQDPTNKHVVRDPIPANPQPWPAVHILTQRRGYVRLSNEYVTRVRPPQNHPGPPPGHQRPPRPPGPRPMA